MQKSTQSLYPWNREAGLHHVILWHDLAKHYRILPALANDLECSGTLERRQQLEVVLLVFTTSQIAYS